MSKWIAEFELEDGDTMPEHMDLNYMGAKIDFHCKPLEQEPKSDWQKDHEILKAYSDGANDVLDELRAEIGNINLNEVAAKYEDRFYGFQREVIKIIDKYKGESE